jgi:hypothetical protein
MVHRDPNLLMVEEAVVELVQQEQRQGQLLM